MKKLIIIKIGGSVITHKDSNKPKARLETITNLAKEISSIFHSNKYQIILVHGAGSFAHPIVKKYDIHKGMNTLEQKIGFGLASIGMYELNLLILKELIKNKVPVVSLPPHAFSRRISNKLALKTELIEEYLNQNMIPILFGDMILDDKLNSSVLSGDTIVPHLAKSLKPEKVIFLSDVDGIFDSDPKKNPRAKLIKEINNKNLDQVLKGITLSNPTDVTGEMKGKILELKKTLPNQPVLIINGSKEDLLTKALTSEQTGTLLHF